MSITIRDTITAKIIIPSSCVIPIAVKIESKENTVDAKKRDLNKFLDFFTTELGTDQIDYWTVSITKEFQKRLAKNKSYKTGKPYRTTTINRIFATMKHCGRWIEKQRAFKAGNPFVGIQDLVEDEPEWKGVTDRQLMLLRGACDQRLSICIRKDQNPFLEVAIFYTLLHTGLRESELCNLDALQYFESGFHEVQRKGRMITKKVFLPTEARDRLEIYLKNRGLDEEKQYLPLLTSRTGNRIAPRDVQRVCERLSRQACVQLPEKEKFTLTPHQLRHTFLKRVTDKHGIHRAKKLSGNIGIRELFRYSQPSSKEIEENVECLYE